jgi:sporulation protein YlmC with PRC-barrel domain
MVRDFTPADEGMEVQTSDGEYIGKIESVEGSTAHVRPDTGLAQSIRTRLGWTDENEQTFKLDHSDVAEITDDIVRLEA